MLRQEAVAMATILGLCVVTGRLHSVSGEIRGAQFGGINPRIALRIKQIIVFFIKNNPLPVCFLIDC